MKNKKITKKVWLGTGLFVDLYIKQENDLIKIFNYVRKKNI